jgi:quinol monooxygenase YgiN
MSMVGGLKVIRVKPGNEAAFEALFAALREEMGSAEPGCLLYSLLRSRIDPQAYIVHEQYADQTVLDAHEASAHGAEFFPKIRALLESIRVEYFDGVVE